jgi:hypothetical protein
MLTTPRNRLLTHGRSSKTYMACMDTLYETADAELNSDETVHDEFHRLRAKYRTFTKSFIRFIRPKVLAINSRDKLGIFEEQVTTVCEQIYKDWERVTP